MQKRFKISDWSKLLFTVGVIYFLAPTLDRRIGIAISATFALANIGIAMPVFTRKNIYKYLCYFGISIVTYYILFNDQPWDFLFHRGMFDSSPLPLIACSMIMSTAGWLLLSNWKARVLYAVITLGAQIPIGLFVGLETFQVLFTQMSHSLHYGETYSGSWQFWQFEWMLTYHLPLFFLPRILALSRKD